MTKGNTATYRPMPLLIALAGFIAIGCMLLSGCGNAPPGITGKLEARPPARIITPSCGPDAGKISMGFDPIIPHDISSIVGFMPLLPAKLPAPLTWNAAVIAGRDWTQKPAPFFHAGYGIWFTRPYTTYALQTVMALDESAVAFSPQTYMSVAGGKLAIASQTSLVVNGSAATLYTLTSSPAQTGGGTTILALEWQQNGVFLRLSAVTSGTYALFSLRESMDTVVAWSGVNTSLLQALAATVTQYAGCR